MIVYIWVIILNIKEELFELKEDGYKIFTENLNPGIGNILGVRIPHLRKIAKKLSKEDWKFYFNEIDDQYFEEYMLKGMVLGYAKEDFTILKPYIKSFVGEIYSWSICDSFCSSLKKQVTDNKEEFFNFISPYFKSDKLYEIRFALVICLQYYIDEEYIDRVLNYVSELENNDYYVEMALAWLLSYVYMYDEELGYDYIDKSNFNSSIRAKSVQKIRDSFRVSKEGKEKALDLKI